MELRCGCSYSASSHLWDVVDSRSARARHAEPQGCPSGSRKACPLADRGSSRAATEYTVQVGAYQSAWARIASETAPEGALFLVRSSEFLTEGVSDAKPVNRPAEHSGRMFPGSQGPARTEW
jgi:hypothetical protein